MSFHFQISYQMTSQVCLFYYILCCNFKLSWLWNICCMIRKNFILCRIQHWTFYSFNNKLLIAAVFVGYKFIQNFNLTPFLPYNYLSRIIYNNFHFWYDIFHSFLFKKSGIKVLYVWWDNNYNCFLINSLSKWKYLDWLLENYGYFVVANNGIWSENTCSFIELTEVLENVDSAEILMVTWCLHLITYLLHIFILITIWSFTMVSEEA